MTRQNVRTAMLALGVIALGAALAGWLMGSAPAVAIFAVAALALLAGLGLGLRTRRPAPLFVNDMGATPASSPPNALAMPDTASACVSTLAFGLASQDKTGEGSEHFCPEAVPKQGVDMQPSAMGFCLDSPEGDNTCVAGDNPFLAELMLHAALEGMLVLDADARIVSANEAALRNLGYDCENEMTGQDVHALIHHSFPDGHDFPSEGCPLYQAIRQGREASLSLTSLRRRDGSQFLASVRVRSLRMEDGEARGALLVFLDVTELHTQETIRQTVFDASTDAYIIFSRDMELEDVNPAALRLFKVQGPSIFRGEAIYALLPALQPDGAETLAVLRSAIEEAWQHGSALLEELLMRDADGVEFPCSVMLVRIDLGGRQALFFNLHDLRSLRQAEAVLGRERRHQQMLLDTNPLGVAVIADDRIAWVNPRADDLVGLHVGARMQSAFVHPGEYTRMKEELERNGIVRDFAVQMFGPKGALRDIYLTALQTEFQGDPGVVAWMMDITDLKATEKALTEARDAAEAATRAKSDFLAHMSHEIRTPMNAILGMGYLCQQTSLTPRQRGYLNKIQDAAHTLMNIINDILEYSQTDSGGMTLEKALFQLDSLIESVTASLLPQARKKNLEFLVRIDPQVPNRLEGDSLRLIQILHALGHNAVKFTDAGEVMLSVNRVREDDHNVTLRFSITDTGIGMSDAEIDKLFQPFSQADASTTRRYGGTGLGLAICKRIVTQMDGRIWVESTPGEGSAFQVVLTLSKENGVTVPALADDFQAMRALVVDDSPAACAVLQEQVKALGFQVHSALSGREGLEMLEKGVREGERWDLLLLDWRMPELNGLETAHLASSVFAGPARPVIILVTESELEPTQEELNAYGIDAFLPKPVSPHVLRDAIMPLLKDRMVATSPAPDVTRVLLVEDNEINQEIALSLLESMNLTVDVANNGKEAVDRVESVPPGFYSLVFMDIQMPEMDGLEASRVIRGMGPHTTADVLPIVAMTAHAQAADREKSLNAGMNEHITKPLDPEELVAVLSQWLGPVSLTHSADADNAKQAVLPKENTVAASPAPFAGGAASSAVASSLPPTMPLSVEHTLATTAYSAAEDAFPGMSEAKGLESVGGNRHLYIKLLYKFRESCQTSDVDMERAVHGRDLELAARIAHTVKGVSASLGLALVSESAADLERILRQGAFGAAPLNSHGELDTHSGFAETLTIFRRVLRQGLASVDAYLSEEQQRASINQSSPVPLHEMSEAQRQEACALIRTMIMNFEADWGAVMESLDGASALLQGTVFSGPFATLQAGVENFDIPASLRAAQKLELELAAK